MSERVELADLYRHQAARAGLPRTRPPRPIVRKPHLTRAIGIWQCGQVAAGITVGGRWVGVLYQEPVGLGMTPADAYQAFLGKFQ